MSFSIPRGYLPIQSPKLSPQAQQQLQSLREQVSPYVRQGIDVLGKQASGDTEAHQAYMQNILQQFHRDVIPSILQRFGSVGSGRNSGLYNALASASSDLGSTLAGRQEDLQQNAIRNLIALQQGLLNTQENEYGFVPKKQSFGKSILSGASGGIGNLIGSLPRSLLSLLLGG